MLFAGAQMLFTCIVVHWTGVDLCFFISKENAGRTF